MSDFKLKPLKVGTIAPPNSPVTSPRNSPRTSLDDSPTPSPGIKSTPGSFELKLNSICKVGSLDQDDELDSSPLPSKREIVFLQSMMPPVENAELSQTVSKVIQGDITKAFQTSESSEAFLHALDQIKHIHTEKMMNSFGESPVLLSQMLEVLDDQMNLGKKLIQIEDQKGTEPLHSQAETSVSGSQSESIAPQQKLKVVSIKQNVDIDELFDDMDEIAKGGNKIAYVINDGDFAGHVLLIAKDHPKNISEVIAEKQSILELEKLKVPLIPILCSGYCDDRPCYIVPRLELDSKKLVKLVEGEAVLTDGFLKKAPILNQKSIDDLTKIQQALHKHKIVVTDLQFMIGKDGSVYLTDPGILLTPKHKEYEEQQRRGDSIINSLIQIAQKHGSKPSQESISIQTVSISVTGKNSQNPELQSLWDDLKDHITRINNASATTKSRRSSFNNNYEGMIKLFENVSSFDSKTQAAIQGAITVAKENKWFE